MEESDAGTFVKQETFSFQSGTGEQDGSMFSKLGGASGAEQPALQQEPPVPPTPPAPPVKKSAAVTSGEFLKMFPDADPGESVLGS